jgi:hypothetical protein
MAGDLSVKTSAFSRTKDKDKGTWSKAFLGSYSGGLGVTDTIEGDGSNGWHRIDNVVWNNYVLFEFSKPVQVNRAFLDSVQNDSDITVWIGNDPLTNPNRTLSDAFLNGLAFTEDNNTTSSSSRWADFNDKGVVGNVLVIAASTSDLTPEDRFKIHKLEIEQVTRGIYGNTGTVVVPGATDSDLSYYTNPALANSPAFLNANNPSWV